MDGNAGREPARCARGPQSRLCPGLRRKKRGRQVEDGAGSSSALPRPCLESRSRLWDLRDKKEGHGPVRAGPEEAVKTIPRAGTPLLWGQAERVGLLQPGEGSRETFPYIKGFIRWRKTFDQDP